MTPENHTAFLAVGREVRWGFGLTAVSFMWSPSVSEALGKNLGPQIPALNRNGG